MWNNLRRLTRRGLLPLLVMLLLALPLLAACAPHDPPTGPVITGDELAKQYQAASETTAHLKAYVETEQWDAARQENEKLTQALTALGPAAYAVESSTWFSIVDAKFDLDGDLKKAKPDRAYLHAAVQELGGALRTAGITLGQVK